jgi:hypothetical protein
MKVFTKRNTTLGVVIGALLVVLTACTPINSAATIGGTSISVVQVQKTVDTILSERTKVSTAGMNLETGEALNRSQLSFYVISELLLQVARESHIDVTEQEITDQIKAVTAQVGGASGLTSAMVNAGIAPNNLRTYFRSYLISQKVSTAFLAAGISKTDVTAAVQKLVSRKALQLKVAINPRYGTWDPQQATIVAAQLAAGAVTK